jgi:hypothetical protein
MLKNYSKGVIYFRYFYVMLFLLIGHLNSFSQLNVVPTYIFLNAPSRSQECIIRNPSADTVEVWIDFKFGYPQMDDTGKVYMVYGDSTLQDPESAALWCKAYPQRFVLTPQAVQVVRLLVTPPASIADGEYWARVVATEKTSKRIVSPGQGKVGMKFNLFSGSDIPIHYRKGKVTTGLSVTNSRIEVVDNTLKIFANLNREGNASFWGKVKIRVVDKTGKVILTNERMLAVYNTLHFNTTLDAKKLTRGNYSLEMVFSGQRNDVKSQFLLQSRPIVQKNEFSIQ